MLSQHFNHIKNLCHVVNPDEAVAYGAAVQAAMIKEGSGTGGHNQLPEADLADLPILVDVTPLSLGVAVMGNYKGEMMSVIIERNSTIPIKRTKEYVTATAN